MGTTAGLEVLRDLWDFPFLDLSVAFVPLEPLTLPRYPGNTLRGAFGWALRRSVCITHQPDCRQCRAYGSCAYAYIFETPIPQRLQGAPRIPYAPHPFVLRPPTRTSWQVGEPLHLGLHLLGRAVHLFPHVIQALETLARGGLGRHRTRLQLLQVSHQGRVLYAQSQFLVPPRIQTLGEWVRQRLEAFQETTEIQVQFLTPTRIVHQGRLLRVPTLEGLLKALSRRLSLLNQVHGNGQPFTLPGAWAAHLPEVQERVETLRPVEVRRFSRRQRQGHELHGFQGTLVLSGPVTPLLPLLLAGEPVHVGKSTSFGMGRYQIRR